MLSSIHSEPLWIPFPLYTCSQSNLLSHGFLTISPCALHCYPNMISLLMTWSSFEPIFSPEKFNILFKAQLRSHFVFHAFFLRFYTILGELMASSAHTLLEFYRFLLLWRNVIGMCTWLVVLFVSLASRTLSILNTEIWSGLILVPSSWHNAFRTHEKLSCQSLHLYIAIKELEYIGHILPVTLLISMTALSAEGPKAIKWIMAPLSFTLSRQFFADPSSPSVSSTISDPSVWEYFSLIICKHNQSIITTGS